MVRCKCEIDGTILARRPTQKEQTDVLFLVESIEFPKLTLKELRMFKSIDPVLQLTKYVLKTIQNKSGLAAIATHF